MATRSGLATATACVTATAALFLLRGSALEAAAAFAAAQTLGVAWLFTESYDDHRKWATAGCVTAAAWTVTFVVPAWIYVADPSLLSAEESSKATAIVTASLFSTLIGIFCIGRFSSRTPHSARIAIEPAALRRGRLLACAVAGVLAISLLFALNGGPIAWVTNLDKTGEMAAGLTYVIFVGLAIKFAAVVAICQRWAEGRSLDPPLIGFLVGAMLVISLLGARAFLAFTFAELLLFYVLVRRPMALKTVLPAGIAVTLLLIFGLGTIKRYQTFREATPASDPGFVDYATHRAIRELPSAYANNYADGLRLVATAERIVPDQADYEYGKVALRLAAQPIPRPLRPKVSTDLPLKRAFEPPGGNQFAIPLQAVSYIQFGLVGVVLAGLMIGLLIGQLDRWLLRRRATMPVLLALIAAAVQVPFLLRAGIPRGLAVSVFEVAGLWAVAKLVLADRARESQPQEATAE